MAFSSKDWNTLPPLSPWGAEGITHLHKPLVAKVAQSCQAPLCVGLRTQSWKKGSVQESTGPVPTQASPPSTSLLGNLSAESLVVSPSTSPLQRGGEGQESQVPSAGMTGQGGKYWA